MNKVAGIKAQTKPWGYRTHKHNISMPFRTHEEAHRHQKANDLTSWKSQVNGLYQSLIKRVNKISMLFSIKKEEVLDYLIGLMEVTKKLSHGQVQECQKNAVGMQKSITMLKDNQIKHTKGHDKLWSSNYNVFKNVAQCLYFKANKLSQEEFMEFYSRTMLNSKPLLKTDNITPKANSSQLLHDLRLTLQRSQNLTALKALTKYEEELPKKIERPPCTRPCCKQLKAVVDRRQNKAKKIQLLQEGKKREDVYCSNSSKEYFKRYYDSTTFDVTTVYSLSKTKGQQMQGINNMYNKKHRQRRQCTKRRLKTQVQTEG